MHIQVKNTPYRLGYLIFRRWI